MAGGPEAVFEARPGPVRITANLGALVRQDARLFGTTVGDEVNFGLGAGVQLPGALRRFEAIAEMYGSTATADPFGDAVTPLEALLGGRWSPSERWRVSLAGGTGITRGIGSPDARAIASLGLVALPELDSDKDSVDDDMDRCPNEPEDRDGFQDDDGCPDPDDDNDGVLDAVDRCRGEPEDLEPETRSGVVLERQVADGRAAHREGSQPSKCHSHPSGRLLYVRRAMGRFEPTGPVDVPGLEHSVVNLSWGVLRGAEGPSDGSAGAASNVPSALGVLRHAEIYRDCPQEVEEAFHRFLESAFRRAPPVLR